MSNNGIVNIHGKEYMTVAKRLELVHGEKKLVEVNTEVIPTNDSHIVIKATVVVGDRGTYTGISSVDLNSSKMIEKSNPYEVAETSAVGRALAFAGYAGSEFPSADEMNKAKADPHRMIEDAKEVSETFQEMKKKVFGHEPSIRRENFPEEKKVCSAHGEPQVMFKGVSKSKFNADGSPKTYWWHKQDGQMCFGDGFKE